MITAFMYRRKNKSLAASFVTLNLIVSWRVITSTFIRNRNETRYLKRTFKYEMSHLRIFVPIDVQNLMRRSISVP